VGLIIYTATSTQHKSLLPPPGTGTDTHFSAEFPVGGDGLLQVRPEEVAVAVMVGIAVATTVAVLVGIVVAVAVAVAAGVAGVWVGVAVGVGVGVGVGVSHVGTFAAMDERDGNLLSTWARCAGFKHTIAPQVISASNSSAVISSQRFLVLS
jgi:hypothetical protein